MNAAVATVVNGVYPATSLRDARLSGIEYDPVAQRSEASRDADRVLYSAAWRRLAGVTQVVTPFEGQATLHTRLTHSEKVAQVARAIALNLLGDVGNHEVIRDLGGLSADASYAAGLAHDIGHPPFGHIGEQVLDEIGRNQLGLHDGFEGNAQTIRILVTRRLRSPRYEGLDLTYATLAAVLKYPWSRVQKNEQHDRLLDTDPIYRRHWNKFNVYDEQADLLEVVRAFLPADFGDECQTLEASVMDVSDDITYAMHDLEDFYIAGLLNVSQMIQDLQQAASHPNTLDELNPFERLRVRLKDDYPSTWFGQQHYFDALTSVLSVLNITFNQRARPTSAEDESLVRSRLSDEISRLLRGVLVSPEPLWEGGPRIGLGKAEWHQVQILKDITKTYVIRDPDVALMQIGQQTILSELVDMLHHWSTRDKDRLPRVLREEQQIATELLSSPSSRGYGLGQFADRGSPKRAILDYLCLLTDMQCITLHEKLSGRRPHRGVVGAGY